MRVKIVDLDDARPEEQAVIIEKAEDCETPGLRILYQLACDLNDVVCCGVTFAIPERLW